jgi:uncharacterized protein (TIGR02453 family)
MFTGFTEETTAFLWGIRLNNNREWFQENKQAYMDHVQKPLGELARDVWTCMTERNSSLDLGCRVCRIYRDARRVRAGGPYKENLWFSLEREHEDWQSTPVFFFEISSEGYMYGLGYYQATPATMKKFRDRLDKNPAEFLRLAEQIASLKDFQIYGDEYSRKKGEKDGRLADWYNRKSVSVIAERKGHDALRSPAFAAALCAELSRLVPLYHFFWSLEGDAQG